MGWPASTSLNFLEHCPIITRCAYRGHLDARQCVWKSFKRSNGPVRFSIFYLYKYKIHFIFFLHTTTIFTIFLYEFPTYFYIMDLFESSSDDDDIFITMMYEYYANELQEKMKPLYEQEAWG